MNSKNHLCVPVSYNFAQCKNGYIVVSKLGSYGVIDTSGNVIVPLNYDTVSQLSKDFFIVTKRGRKGVYNKAGKELLPVAYKKIERIYTDSFLADSILTDNEGNKLLSGVYGVKRFLGHSRIDSTGLYSYRKPLGEGKGQANTGVINIKGKQLLAPEYEDVLYNNCGTFWVKKNNAWGMLDYTGKTLIDFNYAHIWKLRDGIFQVSVNDKFGIVDEHGTEIYPCVYQSLKIANRRRPSYIIAEKDGKMGVIVDFKQAVIIPFEYDDIKYEDNCFKSAQWQTIECKPIIK